MTKDQLLEKANSLPLAPGVYLMHDKNDEIIYVGKAKKLKNRVSQYFQAGRGHNLKTQTMVGLVDTFDTIIVGSEFEALVLENALIKQHMPRYNILLKDDKGYPFVRLSREAYPKFSIVSRVSNDGARYFGPYGMRQETRSALDAVRAALHLPTCHKTFPRDIGKERPCLNHHMGRCDGFCRSEVRFEHEHALRAVLERGRVERNIFEQFGHGYIPRKRKQRRKSREHRERDKYPYRAQYEQKHGRRNKLHDCVQNAVRRRKIRRLYENGHEHAEKVRELAAPAHGFGCRNHNRGCRNLFVGVYYIRHGRKHYAHAQGKQHRARKARQREHRGEYFGSCHCRRRAQKIAEQPKAVSEGAQCRRTAEGYQNHERNREHGRAEFGSAVYL